MNKLSVNNFEQFELLCENIIKQTAWNTCKTKTTMEAVGTSVVLDPLVLTASRYKVQSPFYIAGELCWYMSGSNRLEGIEPYSSFWKKIAEYDGTCRSAYGYLLMEGHGFNQINKVIEVLTKDPNSRQAIMHLHKHPDKPTKDEICTLTIQFLIREEKLYMIVNMRSNDMVLGFTYDSIMFQILHQYVAYKLGVRLGNYMHNAGSSHIYNRDVHRFLGAPEFKGSLMERDYALEIEPEFWKCIKDLVNYEQALRISSEHFNYDDILELKLNTKSKTANLLGALLQLNYLYKRGSLKKDFMIEYIRKHDNCYSKGVYTTAIIWAEINLV